MRSKRADQASKEQSQPSRQKQKACCVNGNKCPQDGTSCWECRWYSWLIKISSFVWPSSKREDRGRSRLIAWTWFVGLVDGELTINSHDLISNTAYNINYLIESSQPNMKLSRIIESLASSHVGIGGRWHPGLGLLLFYVLVCLLIGCSCRFLLSC